MARKKSKSKKAARKNQTSRENEFTKAPHTFVFNRGPVGKNVLKLMLDMRQVMEPYTASSLKARKKNTLKDFVGVAGPLGVSHFLYFKRNESAIHMRLMRLPRGPTLTFRIKKYSLAKDIFSTVKKPSMYATQFLHHPLLVLNNFNGDEIHFKLMTTMFQNMFPSININKVNLNDIRRCVLLNYNADTSLIEFRHYSIKAVPMGVGRSTKKLLQNKVPNLGLYQDVSEFFLDAGQLSESEGEMDGDHNQVTLPQRLGSRGNLDNQKSAIRLTEIGPRLQLKLIKIEEGLCEGEVLHHAFVTKTKQEIAAGRELRQKKKKDKVKRRQQQDMNVAKKQKAKMENKARSLEGMRQKLGQNPKQEQAGEELKSDGEDDNEYYKLEVGQEPLERLGKPKRTKSVAQRNCSANERRSYSRQPDRGQRRRGPVGSARRRLGFVRRKMGKTGN